MKRVDGEVYASEGSENAAMRTYDRLRLGEHQDQALQHAWSTHGEAAFIIHVIETQQDRDRQATLEAKRGQGQVRFARTPATRCDEHSLSHYECSSHAGHM